MTGRAWEARFCEGLADFFKTAASARVDALIADLGHLSLDARRVVRRVRSNPKTRALPIIFLADAGAIPAELLASGADDCLLKPVDSELLAAHVETALSTVRHFSGPESWGQEVLRSRDGRVILNVKGFRCQVQFGLEYEDCRLTRKQLQVLALLMRKPNHVVKWRDFMARGWKPSRLQSASRTLVQHVMRLRQVLGPLGERIETIAGVGYRWRD